MKQRSRMPEIGDMIILRRSQILNVVDGSGAYALDAGFKAVITRVVSSYGQPPREKFEVNVSAVDQNRWPDLIFRAVVPISYVL